jgi:hypothetical protein
MGNQFVQVVPDSTGKKVQTFENTVGGNVVESQGVSLVDPNSGNPLAVQTTAVAGTELALVVRSVPSSTLAQLSQQGNAGTAAQSWFMRLVDASGVNVANVFQFHASDNQALGGTAYGLNTGGVAQLLNQAGNIDRQRETGVDGVPAVGIASGSAQFAMAFQTSDSTDNFAAGTRTFTPALMSGTVQGVAWSIQVGSVLSLDSGGNQENVVVTATTGTTFTCVTAKAHNGTVTAFPVSGFVYNQEKDASGELDGSKGAGAAVAVEYECLSSGAPGGANYDRARNVQGKGVTSSTLNSAAMAATTGVTSIVFTAVTNLQPGQPVYFEPAGANVEVLYVSLGYVPGSLTVTLSSGNTLTHANGITVSWDTYSVLGPGTSGFLATGIGIEEEALWDPVSKLFYLERAATQDAVSAQNVVLESPALWNGATMDRLKGTNGAAQIVHTAQAAGGATLFKLRNAAATVTDVKVSAGTLYGLQVVNNQGAAAYIQVFNLAHASVTLGTTTPDLEMLVPANSALTYPIPATGIAFTTAISVASTTTEGGLTGSAAGVQLFAQYA